MSPSSPHASGPGQDFVRAGDSSIQLVVIYDGDCGVCQRAVDRVRGWDRNKVIECVPSYDDSVRERFPWIPDSAYLKSVQVVRLRDGKTWGEAPACWAVLRLLPQTWWWRWLFVLPGANLAYRWFARRRRHFGQRSHCAS